MGLFNTVGNNLSNRLERKIADWRPVKGEHTTRTKAIEAGYLMAVMFGLLLSLSFAGKSGIAVLMILGMTVLAVSERFLKPAAIRLIYDFMAPKFAWPTWEVSQRLEREQLAEERRLEEEALARGERKPANVIEALFRKKDPAPVAEKAPAEAVVADGEKVAKALNLWAGMPKERRREKALAVADFLAKENAHPMLSLLTTAEEANKVVVAETVLQAIASERKITLAEAVG